VADPVSVLVDADDTFCQKGEVSVFQDTFTILGMLKAKQVQKILSVIIGKKVSTVLSEHL